MTHTPTPWTRGGTSRPDIVGTIQGGLDGGTTILPICRLLPDISGTRQEANARLIAAAPALVAALEKLMPLVESYVPYRADGWQVDDRDNYETVQQARAALTLAKETT